MKKEVMQWMTDIKDEYILDAMKRVPAEKKKKGTVFMYLGMGIGAAAVFAAAIIGGLTWRNDEKTPVEPMTLEITTEVETEATVTESLFGSLLGLEDGELMIIPLETAQRGDRHYRGKCVAIDNNLNVVAQIDDIYRLDVYNRDFVTVSEWNELYGYGGRSGLEPYILPEDGAVVCGAEQLGLYSLKEKRWLVEQEYDIIIPLTESHFLAGKNDAGKNSGTLYILDIVDGDVICEVADVLEVSFVGRSYLGVMSDLAETGEDKQIYDLNGNLVYSNVNCNVYGISGDIAVVGETEGVRILDLPSGKTWELLEISGGFRGVDNAGCFFAVHDREGEDCLIYNAKKKEGITLADFCERNGLALPDHNKVRLSAYNPDTEELIITELLQTNGGNILDEGNVLNCYVCDSDWNVKRTYEAVYAVSAAMENVRYKFPVNGDLAIRKAGDGYEMVDMWTDMTYAIPTELSARDFTGFNRIADEWFVFEQTEENNRKWYTVVFKDGVSEVPISDLNVYDNVLEIVTQEDSGDMTTGYVRMSDLKELPPKELSMDYVCSITQMALIVSGYGVLDDHDPDPVIDGTADGTPNWVIGLCDWDGNILDAIETGIE